MSHSKSQTLPTIKQQRKLTSLNKPIHSFHPKPVYFDQKLVYMDFSLKQDLNHNPQPVSSDTPQGSHWYKILMLTIFAVLLIFVQDNPTVANESEINNHVMSSLVQFGSDPELSTSIIEVLNYTLL